MGVGHGRVRGVGEDAVLEGELVCVAAAGGLDGRDACSFTEVGDLGQLWNILYNSPIQSFLTPRHLIRRHQSDHLLLLLPISHLLAQSFYSIVLHFLLLV